MAALRIAVPGQPVRHIDLGPSYGRAQRPSYGGELVAGESQRQHDLRVQREAMARARGEYVTSKADRDRFAARRQRVALSIHPENRHAR